MAVDGSDEDADPRARIVAAAARLLAEGGRDAVSTRAVSAAAGVQAPTIYRLFGDKQGLLQALAAHGFRAYLAEKAAREPTDDPVEDLCAGWDLHVEMGLAHPELYALMYADSAPGEPAPAAAAAWAVLAAHLRRVAAAGRLRVAEDFAAALLHAAARGVTLSLIATPPERRHPALSRVAREAILSVVVTGAPVTTTPGPAGAAVALRAVLADTGVLSPAEQGLLAEWLDRIADRRP